jgi:hypothetical protein
MSIVANISPTSIHAIVADKSPLSIIAFLASDCWNWSLLPPIFHCSFGSFLIKLFFSCARSKDERWHGQLHGDHVQYILTSLLHGGNPLVIFDFLNQVSLDPIAPGLSHTAITNIWSLSAEQLQCLTVRGQPLGRIPAPFYVYIILLHSHGLTLTFLITIKGV